MVPQGKAGKACMAQGSRRPKAGGNQMKADITSFFPAEGIKAPVPSPNAPWYIEGLNPDESRAARRLVQYSVRAGFWIGVPMFLLIAEIEEEIERKYTMTRWSQFLNAVSFGKVSRNRRNRIQYEHAVRVSELEQCFDRLFNRYLISFRIVHDVRIPEYADRRVYFPTPNLASALVAANPYLKENYAVMGR